jgi:hypothetical protein
MNLFTAMENKQQSQETKLRSSYSAKLSTVLEIMKDLSAQSLFIDCITSDQEANIDATIEFITAVKNQVDPVFFTSNLNLAFSKQDQKFNEDQEAWEQKLNQPM